MNERSVRDHDVSRAIRADERGTVMVEYTVILVLVTMGCVLAMVGLGGPLVSAFETQQAWLLLPFP